MAGIRLGCTSGQMSRSSRYGFIPGNGLGISGTSLDLVYPAAKQPAIPPGIQARPPNAPGLRASPPLDLSVSRGFSDPPPRSSVAASISECPGLARLRTRLAPAGFVAQVVATENVDAKETWPANTFAVSA